MLRQDQDSICCSRLFNVRFALIAAFVLLPAINALAQSYGSKERVGVPDMFDGAKSSCCGTQTEQGSFSPLNSPEYETYRLTATYYTLRSNLATTLMLNNKGPVAILATPTIYPDSTASQRWHGNGLRLRNLNGAKLDPILIARNNGAQTSTIQGKIPYTRSDGTMGSVPIPPTPIAPKFNQINKS